jgi:hypothetical protein
MDDVPAVPAHPLHQLTTYELTARRRELEHAVAYFGAKTPVPPVCGELAAALDEVLAEQEDRQRIREAV